MEFRIILLILLLTACTVEEPTDKYMEAPEDDNDAQGETVLEDQEDIDEEPETEEETTPETTSSIQEQIDAMKQILENMPAHMKAKMPASAIMNMENTIANMEQMMQMGMEDMIDENALQEMMTMMMQTMGGGEQLDISQGIPKFATSNFIELDRIDRMSKLRSGYGHDFSYGTDEECRSMKHYFWAKGGDPGGTHNPPWMTVKYYSPVDGTLRDVIYTEHEYGQEAQFVLHPTEQTAFRIKFFHVKLLDEIQSGAEVTAGQEIGTIGHEDAHGEIAVEIDTTAGLQLVSFLEIVDETVFSEYEARGIVQVEDVIITKEERDANPLECDYSTEAGFFVGREDDPVYQAWAISSENWFFFD